MSQTQDQPQHAPATTGDAPPAETSNGGKRMFMRAVIAVTVLLCVAMVWVLFWRWITVQEPSSMITIHGGKEMAGATVVAEAFGVREPYKIPLNESGNGRFFPQPGRYQLRVFYGESHEVTFKDPLYVEIAPDTYRPITLERAVATTRPWLKP